MLAETNEFQNTAIDLICDICNTVDDWMNWKIVDYTGIYLESENSEERIFMDGIIFICPNCQTENFISWCGIIESIARTKLSSN